jgi:hypothetical protein
MMQLSAMTQSSGPLPNLVGVGGPLPNLVGSYGGADLMGFDSFGSPTVGAGIGAVVLSSVVTFGLTWWAFKTSREGSNWKPAVIMAAPVLIFGLLAS